MLLQYREGLRDQLESGVVVEAENQFQALSIQAQIKGALDVVGTLLKNDLEDMLIQEERYEE